MKRLVSMMVLIVLVFAVGISPPQTEAVGSQEPDSSAPNPIEERGVPMPSVPGQAVPSFPIQPKIGKPCPSRMGVPFEKPSPNPDVCISSLLLNESRHVAFTVRNVGGAGTGAPFLVDVYVNNAKTDSIPIPPMSNGTALSLEAHQAFLAGCQTASVRLILDPQRAVPDADRTNNEYAETWPSPCPDVTAEITQNKVNNNLQYYAHVKVSNQGTMPMPAVQVRTLGVTYNPANTPPPPGQCIQNGNCDVKDSHTVGPLAPGQAVGYNVDPKFMIAQTLVVEVTILCGPPNTCLELNQGNNTVRKTIGPH